MNELYNDLKKLSQYVILLVTSTMAVKTELTACEPDFHVPNPIAGMLCPLNRSNDFVFGSCGLTVCAIFNKFNAF